MANHSVLIDKLDCKIIEKGIGNTTEIFFNYIIDDCDVRRFPLSGNYSIKKNDVWDINLQLSFNSKIVIVLVEVESQFSENDLGIITINSSLCAGKGSFSNRNNSYHYELSYCMVPLFSVELANLECIKNTAGGEECSEIYLKYKLDNGQELRYPTCGNLIARQGEYCYLGLNLQFNDNVLIYLMESASTKHKELGMIQLNSSILNGFQHFTNKNDDWDFIMIYFRSNQVINQKKEINKQEFALL